jgi:hypothetical protein
MNSIISFLVNAFKSFDAVTLIFLLISFYLTRQESNYAIVLGYISIVWWSLILLINIYKKFNNNNNIKNQ